MSRDISYDVRVLKTYVYAGKRGRSYTVRWRAAKAFHVAMHRATFLW
jgi:hypothetical protein